MSLPYIINVALILAACLAFYKVLLRRETFYRMNRYLLVICLAVSFTLPLLQVPQRFSMRAGSSESIVDSRESMVKGQNPQINSQRPTMSSQQLATGNKQNESRQKAVVGIKSAEDNKQPGIANTKEPETGNLQPVTSESPRMSLGQFMSWFIGIYWFGVIIFAGSFIFQMTLLLWRALRYPVIKDGIYRIVEMHGDHAPCSFGNTIFINPSKYDWEVYNQILSHEKIHVQQKHTLDIIVAELVLIFQWFNPFAWIYRREIENNLEFLTDDQVVQQNEVDKKSYQLSLVKVSAPHLPLRLTTNYNQSILKTRIAMMNKKRSNLHTAWKYFFLLPVFAFLACLLNEPMVKAQGKSEKPGKSGSPKEGKSEKRKAERSTEGYWFAIIKGEKVTLKFSDEKIESDDPENKSGHSFSSGDFQLAELGTLPRGSSGTFNIKREAGTMQMTGKFDGNTGMGTYKFVADQAYVSYMNNELNEKLDDDDQMTFYFINIKKDFLTMLKTQGFKNITKDDLIPVAALNIDQAYIKSIRDAGYKDVSLENLVPMKALGIDAKYIAEIKTEYKNISTDQLVSFKAQGIDKSYVQQVRQMKGDKAEKSEKGEKDEVDPDDVVSFKAMNITPEFANSFKQVGLNNIPHEQLVALKAVGVTPEYVKSWQNAGFKDIDAEGFVGMKAQNVTPEYMKTFVDMGYKDIKPETLLAFKALEVTPDYIRSFQAMGYKNIDEDNITGLKAQNVTPEFIKSFETVGFKDISLEDIVAVKATGVTPEYIKEMKAKGFNYDKLQKYITLKSLD